MKWAGDEDASTYVVGVGGKIAITHRRHDHLDLNPTHLRESAAPCAARAANSQLEQQLSSMSLVVPEANTQFQHILRLLNTNVDGKRKIMYALTEIKGVGRRYANLVCKKADVDLGKR